VGKSETVVALVFLLFGALVAILALQMPLGTFRMAGPGLFPLCLGLVLMALAGGLLVQLRLAPPKTKPPADKAPAEPLARPRLLAFLGVLVGATLGLDVLGFILTIFLTMLSLLMILGSRRWLANLGLALVTALASHGLFVMWLKIPLPAGWLRW
jgi:hypothetical protein